jgi:replicative DNA helicase
MAEAYPHTYSRFDNLLRALFGMTLLTGIDISEVAKQVVEVCLPEHRGLACILLWLASPAPPITTLERKLAARFSSGAVEEMKQLGKEFVGAPLTLVDEVVKTAHATAGFQQLEKALFYGSHAGALSPECADKMRKVLDNVTRRVTKLYFHRKQEDFEQAIHPKNIECVPTGIPELDQLVHGGLPKRGYTLLGGCSGAGKTALALNFAAHAAKRGEKCVILQLDMDKDRCAAYYMMIYHQCTLEQLRSQGVPDMGDNFVVCSLHESHHVSVAHLRRALAQIAYLEPKMLIIDHVQSLVMHNNFAEHHTLLAAALQNISTWSKQHNVATLCLSQLNRTGTKNDAFRSSSSLMEASDLTLLLTGRERTEDYQPDLLDIEVLKNRQGHMRVRKLALQRSETLTFSAAKEEELPVTIDAAAVLAESRTSSVFKLGVNGSGTTAITHRHSRCR